MNFNWNLHNNFDDYWEKRLKKRTFWGVTRAIVFGSIGFPKKFYKIRQRSSVGFQKAQI